MKYALNIATTIQYTTDANQLRNLLKDLVIKGYKNCKIHQLQNET